MNERDYHDHHYAVEAGAIESSVLFARVHKRTAREFLRRSGIGGAHRVLSLGCGDGAIERLLAPHVGEVVGIDVSGVAIGQARARAEEAGLGNLSFVVSEGDAPRFGELGRFDAIAAFAFLHHLRDGAIGETFRAARDALRSGGLFYSVDPSSRRLVGLFAGLVRKTYDRYHSPDERELDPAALSALAAGAGFEPRVGYVDYFLGPLAWLAPGTPAWLAPGLEALDNAALAVPLLRRYASSFSLLARAHA
jgi:SAM-dependent methyltransferase